jgi:hypothetical protein
VFKVRVRSTSDIEVAIWTTVEVALTQLVRSTVRVAKEVSFITEVTSTGRTVVRVTSSSCVEVVLSRTSEVDVATRTTVEVALIQLVKSTVRVARDVMSISEVTETGRMVVRVKLTVTGIVRLTSFSLVSVVKAVEVAVTFSTRVVSIVL